MTEGTILVVPEPIRIGELILELFISEVCQVVRWAGEERGFRFGRAGGWQHT